MSRVRVHPADRALIWREVRYVVAVAVALAAVVVWVVWA